MLLKKTQQLTFSLKQQPEVVESVIGAIVLFFARFVQYDKQRLKLRFAIIYKFSSLAKIFNIFIGPLLAL